MMLRDLGKVPSDVSASKELNWSWNTTAVVRRLKNDVFGEAGGIGRVNCASCRYRTRPRRRQRGPNL